MAHHRGSRFGCCPGFEPIRKCRWKEISLVGVAAGCRRMAVVVFCVEGNRPWRELESLGGLRSRAAGRTRIAHCFSGGLAGIIRFQSRQGRQKSSFGHTFTSTLLHVVFSTKDRLACLTPEIETRLWSYIGGIARAHEMKALAVGGVADHIHVLISIPPTLALSKAVQLLKGNSSKWIHETFPNLAGFEWQAG